MFIVTGGAGFIGSNIVKGLNSRGYKDILVVDDLSDGTKFANIADLDIIDYMDKNDFIDELINGFDLGQIDAIFHEGACSSTTEWDGKFLMQNNYEYSKIILHYCLEFDIPFFYASSASVYGGRTDNFVEDRQYERPLNAYGYSKFLFDQYVRQMLPEVTSPVCGFRYFNVYGPREAHKGNMASVAYHLNQQLHQGQALQLFEGSDHFLRDFVYIDDVVDVNLWCWEHKVSGIYNCGTGRAESFQTVANAVLAFHQKGNVDYIPFPDELKGRYQTFTQADLTHLRSTGCNVKFKDVTQGVTCYMQWLNAQHR